MFCCSTSCVASLSGLSILDFPFGLYRLFAEYSAIDTDVSKDCDSVAIGNWYQSAGILFRSPSASRHSMIVSIDKHDIFTWIPSHIGITDH